MAGAFRQGLKAKEIWFTLINTEDYEIFLDIKNNKLQERTPCIWLKWKTSCSRIEAYNGQTGNNALGENLTHATSQNCKQQKRKGCLSLLWELGDKKITSVHDPCEEFTLGERIHFFYVTGSKGTSRGFSADNWQLSQTQTIALVIAVMLHSQLT